MRISGGRRAKKLVMHRRECAGALNYKMEDPQHLRYLGTSKGYSSPSFCCRQYEDPALIPILQNMRVHVSKNTRKLLSYEDLTRIHSQFVPSLPQTEVLVLKTVLVFPLLNFQRTRDQILGASAAFRVPGVQNHKS